ncbi:META domain-containing protein [Actibacterium ureilyticum]|uniref:META domain-containing protein n=1 Tax=Actibacterium ureilyticum TaxID=1590614 RepID=UPI000BAB15AD|nr:META domain-containing protein [Actibacterium ureilyticum]
MTRALALLALLALPACRDESLSGFVAPDQAFALREIDGTRFTARATLTFPEPGRIAGTAPCNSYSGTLTAPYPWFETGAIMATERACPDLAQETAFFAALSQMTLAEVSGKLLILSNDAGRQMLFQAP